MPSNCMQCMEPESTIVDPWMASAPFVEAENETEMPSARLRSHNI
jgi:hypothetical protein